MVKRRGRGRGRRRRNVRTQQPVRVTSRRTGAGGVTVEETYEWLRPPSGWDVAVAGMATEVRKAQAAQKRAARKRYIRRAEHRKESRAEAWRRKYQTPGDSPFMRLPGMSGRGETTNRRRQSTISATERQQSGLASRGSRSTLTPETAAHILELRTGGMSYREIGERTGHPATTIRHWIVSGRASAVTGDRGQTN